MRSLALSSHYAVRVLSSCAWDLEAALVGSHCWKDGETQGGPRLAGVAVAIATGDPASLLKEVARERNPQSPHSLCFVVHEHNLIAPRNAWNLAMGT